VAAGAGAGAGAGSGGLLEMLAGERGEYAAEHRRQALASGGFTRRQFAQRQLWLSTLVTLGQTTAR
jgi:hypothetical protein